MGKKKLSFGGGGKPQKIPPLYFLGPKNWNVLGRPFFGVKGLFLGAKISGFIFFPWAISDFKKIYLSLGKPQFFFHTPEYSPPFNGTSPTPSFKQLNSLSFYFSIFLKPPKRGGGEVNFKNWGKPFFFQRQF